jgi:hypothetical protein
MGVGACRQFITIGDLSKVPPGYFWCEIFQGDNVTVDYEWQNNNLTPVFAARGSRTSNKLYRFSGWHRIESPDIKLPDWTSSLNDVPRLNIEYIDNKIIEIHLRRGDGNFPPGATDIIPIWSDMSQDELEPYIRRGYNIISNYDDSDGNMTVHRIGFLYR